MRYETLFVTSPQLSPRLPLQTQLFHKPLSHRLPSDSLDTSVTAIRSDHCRSAARWVHLGSLVLPTDSWEYYQETLVYNSVKIPAPEVQLMKYTSEKASAICTSLGLGQCAGLTVEPVWRKHWLGRRHPWHLPLRYTFPVLYQRLQSCLVKFEESISKSIDTI